jgi:hypothetical protein
LQFRVAWPYPLTRIRDLPWPRLPPPVRGSTWLQTPSAVTTAFGGRPRAQPVQPRCHDRSCSIAEVIELT